MKLYHLSTNIYHDGVFEPRIPSDAIRMKGEESETPRICVSKTLEGCFSAIPGGGSGLDALNYSQKGYYKVFEIDTEKLDIQDDDLLTSTFLYESGKVEDAEITDEFWVLKPFTVSKEDSYIIFLEDWNEEVNDLIPHHIVEVADKEYDGDYFQAYYDIMESDLIPCTNSICDVHFKKDDIPAGEVFEHPHIEHELSLMNDYLSIMGSQLENAEYGSFIVKGQALSIEDLAKTHLACSW